jgi:hypothetical protein
MPGLDPGIHEKDISIFSTVRIWKWCKNSWMPGSSPGMTTEREEIEKSTVLTL